MEPARFFYSMVGNGTGADNVDTHGNNWYISFLNSTLNCHLPLFAAYWDTWPNATTDFWVGLSEAAWAEFGADNHFGMQYQGIHVFKKSDAKSTFLKDGGVQNAQLPRGNGNMNPAKHWANEAVNPKNDETKKLAIYAERFAHFFERRYFVNKAFNKLNSEEKPEHAGFRKACETLYEQYRKEQSAFFPDEYFTKKELPQGELDDSLIEHAFHDDMYIEFATENIDRFFVWLGVMKPSAQSYIPPRTGEKLVSSLLSEDEDVPPLINQMSTLLSTFAEAASLGDGPSILQAFQMQHSLALKIEEEEEDKEEVLSTPSDMKEGSLEMITKLNELLKTAMQERNTNEIRRLMAERDHHVQIRTRELANEAEADTESEVSSLQALAVSISNPFIATSERNNLLNKLDELHVMNEQLVKFVDEFVDIYTEALKQGPDFRAAVFERWQMFELDNEDKPMIIRRAAQLIANHNRFQEAVKKEIKSATDCLRDTSGIIFRLHGMWKDGEFDLRQETASPIDVSLPGSAAIPSAAGNFQYYQLLQDAVETILAPFEGDKVIQSLDGHFVGSLYMQALTPWLCAARNATSTRTLKDTVRRVGHAVVNWYQQQKDKGRKQQVKNRIHEMYLMLSHHDLVYGERMTADDIVWESRAADVIWTTFY